MSVTVRGETDRTATSMDDLRSYYLASAGVEKAAVEMLWSINQGAGLIPQDGSPIDYQFPSGVAHVEIIPETAKLNINRATVDQLTSLFAALGVDGARASTIAAGIIDWRSPGGAGSPFDAYYLSLTPSFRAPHASFQEIEELLSVQGVTPDIFYGSWVVAGNGDAGENPLVRHPGLNDCLTVYGMPGNVDLNLVLAAANGTLGAAGGPSIINGQNAVVTFRSTAHLKLSDGQFSDMRRTVGAEVKFLPWGSPRPFDVMRWYNTTWSY
jgi:hypothetical protein